MVPRRLVGGLLAGTTAAATAVAIGLAAPPATAQGSPSLPPGFVLSSSPSGQAAGDLTDFAYLPDGSVLTTGKGGKVAWVSPTGAARTLATLPVTTVQDLGLVGLAVAPDYESSRAVYLARALPGSTNNWPLRLSRFTVTGSPEPTGLTGEQVLLETTATSDVHAVTGVVAAADDTVWVSVGDAADFRFVDPAALRALDGNDVRGKVLHLAADGRGVPSNPFYDAAAPGAARSKVYASGFRSPFRLSLDPASGIPLLGDVGWNTFEEVDVIRPGASFGWPCWEGDARTGGYRDLPGCAGVPQGQLPAHFYPRSEGSSVTGGVVYTGSAYPEAYQGAYFFGDYTSQRIWTMQLDDQGAVVRGPESAGFGRDMGGAVAFRSGPNGDIVYADIYSGLLRRISYAPGNRAPVANATTTTDPATRTVSFDGSGSYDLDGDPLTYRWDFGDGTSGTGVSTSHRYVPGDDPVTAHLTVSDAQGASGVTEFTVMPSNNAPQLDLVEPRAGTVYAVGDIISAGASAADSEDGQLPVTWRTVLVHCRDEVCHDHPGLTFTAPRYDQPFSDHGDDTELRISATATDSDGVTTTQTFVAEPKLRQLALTSNVPATMVLNGSPANSGEITVGATVSISAPDVAADGVSRFERWNDGAPQQRTYVMPDADTTLTASYVYVSPIDERYNSDPALRATVGSPVRPETGEGGVRWRDYTAGRVYWSAETGVHEVHGAILQKFFELGAHGGYGVPTTDELAGANGGRYNIFTGGRAIYWTQETGARAVYGLIKERYDSLGAEGGFLRYPVTDELGTPDATGRYNHFQDGSIYFSPGTGAWQVGGAIRDKWRDLGWERSFLGYPTSNETGAPDGVGRYNTFASQNGAIYWTPGTWAHEIHGAIRTRWAQIGAESGPLGYPSADERGTPDGVGRFSEFSGNGGMAYWTPGTGAWEVYGAIRARWGQLGYERSYLGYPISGEFAVPGGRRSNFQRGYIVWDAATGQTTDRRY